MRKMIYSIASIVAVASYLSLADAQWTANPLCPYPSDNLIRFPYEGDCSKYWECYQGARYPMDCPSGFEFNAEKSVCDDPTIANCDPDSTIIYPTFPHSTETTPSSSPTEDPGPIPECPFPSDELVFFPVANNCSQYWECFQGNRYLMSCPDGEYWNQEASYCDYPYNVDCQTNNTTTTPGSVTTESPVTTSAPNTGSTVTDEPIPSTTMDPTCIGLPDGSYLTNPNDCHRYYECVDGKVIDRECGGDLLWNEDILTCDYPENVNCNIAVNSRS